MNPKAFGSLQSIPGRTLVTVVAQGSEVDGLRNHRRALLSIACRILGSTSDAEDAVQEAYFRWHQADRARVKNPIGFLVQVVRRICLDYIKSARIQREICTSSAVLQLLMEASSSPSDQNTESDICENALTCTLERLSPLERSAFLLHDIFDFGFAEVAIALGRQESTCRRLAARGRSRIKNSVARFTPSPTEGRALYRAFHATAQSGSSAPLLSYVSAYACDMRRRAA
jgi:RNA polymerase sigma-70 factor (ECF subfamily)